MTKFALKEDYKDAAMAGREMECILGNFSRAVTDWKDRHKDGGTYVPMVLGYLCLYAMVALGCDLARSAKVLGLKV